MRLRTHILTSALLGAALYSRAPRKAALLVAGGVLLDADHYLLYALRSGNWSPLSALRYDRWRNQPIAAGEKVIMYYSAANRDPSIFPDPDRLDVRRSNASKNIAFGFGPHVCIGKRVAQLQLEEVYRQLLTRLPDIEYAGGIEMAPNNFVHAIRKLPVRFTPQRSI